MATPRWGVMGVGGISNDFCIGLVNNCSTISAVAARDLSRAQAFATKFKADHAHGSYEALASDPEVDVVYVGTIHTMHLEHARLALNAGKHVVCEKPLAMNEAQAKELVDLARKKGLFFMEAMWTRFFPAVRKVREVLSSGAVGTPKCLQADFGFVGPAEDNHRLNDLEQGGGGVLDIGVYLIQAATMVFGASLPEQVACSGQRSKTGVDCEGALALTWDGKGSASLLYSICASQPGNCMIMCTEGYVRIKGPFHCPEEIVVSKAQGRGPPVEETFKFELPKCPDGYKVNYPNSEGMLYEVQAVEELLKGGKLESPEYPLDETLVLAQICDIQRKTLGVVYPCEK